MAFGSKKGTQIYFSFSLKSPGKRTPSRFPNRAPMKGDNRLQGILHVSQKPHYSGSPRKGTLPQSPLHGIPHRGTPHHWSPPSFIYQSPRCTIPPSHITRFTSDGNGTPWRKMPVSGDFLNGSSRFPSEGAPPEAPSTEPLQRVMLHPQSPLHPALKVPGRRAVLQVPQTGLLWKEMPVSRAFSKYPSGSPAREPPPSSLHRAPTERDTPHPESFSAISQSLWLMNPLKFVQLSLHE